jgi:uncharacterized ion transporter superfamily protein YfcC
VRRINIEEKAGAQISRKAFVQSVVILAALMVAAGILLPIADLVGVTRQVAVVSYPKWLKWTARLWLWFGLATVIFLANGVAIHYGPF